MSKEPGKLAAKTLRHSSQLPLILSLPCAFRLKACDLFASLHPLDLSRELLLPEAISTFASRQGRYACTRFFADWRTRTASHNGTTIHSNMPQVLPTEYALIFIQRINEMVRMYRFNIDGAQSSQSSEDEPKRHPFQRRVDDIKPSKTYVYSHSYKSPPLL